MELKAEKDLVLMLANYEKFASSTSISSSDSIDIAYKKTQALLILAFVSWRAQKTDQAEKIFDRAFEILPTQNPQDDAFDVAKLLDEAARFYDSQGKLNRAAFLHFKAADLRNGSYADFYIGLILKSAGRYDEACEWFRLALERRDYAERHGLLSKAESALHRLVIYGNIGETMWLKAATQSNNQEAKRQARIAFEEGDKLAATYLEWLETENKFSSLDRGLVNFYRRYLVFLSVTDQEEYTRQRNKVLDIIRKAGLDENALKASASLPSKFSLTFEIPRVKDFSVSGFSNDGNYVLLKAKTKDE